MNKILRYVCLVGLFLVPLIPLVVLNSLFFPFITGKNFAFRIIVEIIFGAWMILAVTDVRYRPKWTWLPGFVLAFVGVMALADAASVFPYKSVWSNFERMEGLVTLIHLAAYFFVAATVLNTERLWNWLFNTTIGVSLIVTVYGFLQVAGRLPINQGGVRLDATFGNATYLAIYVVFHIFLTAYLLVSDNKFLLVPRSNNQPKNEKYIVAGVIILLELIVLYHTATRGAILGLIGGALVAAGIIAWKEKQRSAVRKTAIGMIVALVIIVGGFLAVKDTAFVKNSPVMARFSSISITEKTTMSRFYLWNMAFQGFKERPVLGWGQESFNYVFNKYYDPRLYNQEQWFDRTHNVIFDWLIAGGILGLGTYLLLFGSLAWYVSKSDKFTIAQKSVLIGLLVAYFIHNLFVFDNIVSYILYFTIAAYIFSKSTQMHHVVEHKLTPNRVVAPLAIIATLLILYYVNVPAINQNRSLIKSLSLATNTSVTANVAKFKDTLAYNSFGTPETREQIMIMSQQVLGSQQGVAGAQELGQLAIDEGQKQVLRTPNDARYYILYGSFLAGTGLYQIAEPVIAKGVALTPKKQSALFVLGSTQIGLREYDKAAATFKKALDLAPEYQDARIYYAVSLIYGKKNTEALAVLESLPADVLAQNDQVLNAYYVTGQYKTLAMLWKKRVELSPDNPQYRLSLAASYILNNENTKAIAEIEEAIRLAPTFKEQGEQYIKDIKAGKKIF